MQAGGDLEHQFALLKQWYETTSEKWSLTIAEVIGTEQFAEATGRLLESYASFDKCSGGLASGISVRCTSPGAQALLAWQNWW